MMSFPMLLYASVSECMFVCLLSTRTSSSVQERVGVTCTNVQT